MAGSSSSKSKADTDPRTADVEGGEVVARDDSGLPAPVSVEDADLATVKLAHPITRKVDMEYLGLDPEGSYSVGQEIKVNRNAALSLINAGMVQVDPNDIDAVNTVIGVEPAQG